MMVSKEPECVPTVAIGLLLPNGTLPKDTKWFWDRDEYGIPYGMRLASK
jgi:hypothetical protein